MQYMEWQDPYLVYNINKGSSASIHSGSQFSSAVSIASCHQISVSSFQGAYEKISSKVVYFIDNAVCEESWSIVLVPTWELRVVLDGLGSKGLLFVPPC